MATGRYLFGCRPRRITVRTAVILYMPDAWEKQNDKGLGGRYIAHLMKRRFETWRSIKRSASIACEDQVS